MSILEKTLACSRFRITSLPASLEFENSPYARLPVGSQRRESSGFLPLAPDEPYKVDNKTWYFRVGFDKIAPCPTQVNERYKSLVNAEPAPPSPAQRKKLKDLAEEEIAAITPPRTKIIDGVIIGKTLYLGTASNTHLGSILDHLNRIGIQADPVAPWLDAELPEPEDSPFDGKDGVQSAHGCDFLAHLCRTEAFPYERESGSASLVSDHGGISCTGAVGEPLDTHLTTRRLIQIKMHHVVQDDDPRVLTLDGSRFRIKSAKLPKPPKDVNDWREVLDFRVEEIKRLWSALDEAWETYAAEAGLRQEAVW